MCQLFLTVRAVPGAARLWLLAVLVASAALPAASVQAGEKAAKKYPTLEKALQTNAPTILDFLRKIDKGGKPLHAGVLKFRVQVGENPPSDNIGPLNLLMASRLEAALILDPSFDGKDKIRILHDPSAVIWANGNSRANPDTPEGRKAFFNGYTYSPAWKERKDTKDKLPAHLFLTGLVKIDGESKIATVSVCAFNRTGEEPKPVCAFEAIADPRLLTEAGISFALPRGGNRKTFENLEPAEKNQDPDWPTNAKAVAVAVSGGFKPVPPPANTKKSSDLKPPPEAGGVPVKKKEGTSVQKLLKDAPIQFEILYDGEPAELRPDGSVSEPLAGTKVTFRLKHKNKDDSKYGVVLKINGRNTIYPNEQEIDDFAYHKWVLEPGDNFEIGAFLMENNEAKEFKVLSSSESRHAEPVFGAHAGMFAVIVYQERRDGKESRLVRFMNGNDLVAYSRGMPSGSAVQINDSLKGLKKQLSDAGAKPSDASRGGRGMVVAGKKTVQEADKVSFKGYPIPVSAIQIRYYQPRNKEE